MAVKKTQKAEKVEKAETVDEAEMDYTQFGVSGFESTTQDDIGLPFLTLVQKGSPEFDETHPDHATYGIEGCKPGAIVNSLSRELLYMPGQDPLRFIPSTHQKLFVEWRSRNSGGGFVKAHADPTILDSCTRNDKGRDVLPSGNEIVPTSYFFGHYIHPETGELVKSLIAMTSTQLKKARLWLNQAISRKVTIGGKQASAPLFACEYLLTTQPESNEKGSWFGWNIESAGFLQDRDILVECAGWAKQALQSRERLLLASPKDDDHVPEKGPF